MLIEPVHTIKGKPIGQCPPAVLETELQVMAVFPRPTGAQMARVKAIRDALLAVGANQEQPPSGSR
jgi:hypothetical protein